MDSLNALSYRCVPIVVSVVLAGCACGTAGKDPAVGSAGAAGESGSGGANAAGTTGSGGAAASAGAAGSGGSASTCAPLATEACDCAGGSGARRCLADGSAWSTCECFAYGAELFVSPTGSDTGDGSAAAPLQTLERARDEVRARVASGLPEGGIVVWLRGGTYERASSLVLGASDSGSAGKRVVWRGYPGETVRLIGGRKLDTAAFKPVPSTSPVYSRLDASVRDKVLAIDLSALGVTSFGTLERRGFCRWEARAALELAVNGVALPLARWPDRSVHEPSPDPMTAASIELFGAPSPDVTGRYTKGALQDGVPSFTRDGLVGSLQYKLYRNTWDYQGNTYTAWFLTTQSSGYPGNANPWWYRYSEKPGRMQPYGEASATGTVETDDPNAIHHGFASIAESVSNTSFRYHGDRPARWQNAPEVWFHGYFRYHWEDCHLKAASIDTSTRTVSFSDAPSFGIEAGMPYYAYNLVEEITEPGEWWLDRATGVLYLLPPKDFASADVVISELTLPIVLLNDTQYVELVDLTLESSQSELVRVSGGSHNVLRGLTLRNAGMNAATISGTENGAVDCHVYGPGAGGIRVSGGNRRSLTSGKNYVEHSHFHDFSRMERTYRPAVSLDGVGHRAANNLMHSAPHSAILFGGNEHLIEKNEIHRVLAQSSDAGAIYAGRDWGARGNVVRHNFIHHISTIFEGYGVHGVYLDDCLSGIRVEGNVLYEITDNAIQHGGGRDNIMVGNVIVRSGTGLAADSRGFEWRPAGGPNDKPGDSWNLLEKLNQVGYQDEPWASRYPECAAIPNDFTAIIASDARWLYPEGCVFSRNIGYQNGRFIGANQLTRDSYAELANNLEDTDPRFVDEANLDLSLAPDSPALKIPGFEPIPFSEIGIRAR
jgi:hypothetical protein